jgi:hypothetical protein
MAKVNKSRVTGVHRPKPSTTASKTKGTQQRAPSKKKTASPPTDDQYEAGGSPNKSTPASALSLPDTNAAPSTPKDSAVPPLPKAELASARVLTTPKTPPSLTEQQLILGTDCVARLSEELGKEVTQPSADFQVITSGAQPIILTPSFAIKFIGEVFQAEELEAMDLYRTLGEAVPQWQAVSLTGAETEATLESLTTCAESEKAKYDTIVKKMERLESEQRKKQKNYMDHLPRLKDIQHELQSLDPSGQGDSYSATKALEKCDRLLLSLKNGDSFLLGTRVRGENLGTLLLEEEYNVTLFEDGAKDLNSILFQMGRVAVKDLLTGNSDRLCELKKNPTDDSIDLRVSFNTGNLMLDPSDGISEARMVCIDNGVSLRLSNDEFQSGIDSHFDSLPDMIWARLKEDHFTPDAFSSTQTYQAYQKAHPDCDDEFHSWLRAGISAGLDDLKACDEAQLPDDAPLLKDRLAILQNITP